MRPLEDESDENASIARRIQMHQVTLNQRHSAAGLTTLSDQQRKLFAAVDLPVPVRNAL
jgi:hypothetical protein